MKTQTPISKEINYAKKCLMINFSCVYNAEKQYQRLSSITELSKDNWFIKFIDPACEALKVLKTEGVITVSQQGDIHPGINFIPLED
ncbi:MAG: hypothetical protein H7196_04590 [candidate division SR1 bacterium]|nr:hypothetical protein [candidate division SR1 bacterium]